MGEFPNRAGRPPAKGGPKTTVVATRLNEAETAHLDHQRGSLSRAMYLRVLLKRDGRASKPEET